MTSQFILGLFLVILAGALEGLFSIGVARTPNWKFENIWGVGSLVALVLVPWPLALLTVPHLGEVYRSISPSLLFIVFVFGVCWGLGGIFWGKAITAVGMALGVSLLMGFINIFGSMGPLAIREPGKLLTHGGITLIVAVIIMLLGVIVIARAGKLKEKEMDGNLIVDGKSRIPFVIGLIFCLLSGVLSAMVNFSFIYGGPIAQAAADHGASQVCKGFAIWALVFTGNYGVNLIYSLVQMSKNQSFGLIVSGSQPSYWLWALFMGLAWPLGIAVYGMAAFKLGAYGAYVAFPMMLLCSILAGNLAGAVMGEWKGTSLKPKLAMLIGVTVLFAAFIVLGFANKLLSGAN